VGCYSSSPLKKNLVPRFLSVVLEWCRDYVRVRLQRLLFHLVQRCRSSLLAKVDGERFDVAGSFLSNPRRGTLKVSRVKLSSMPEEILRELEGF
jgi:hypothetical protein